MADVENKMMSSSSEVFEAISEGVFSIPADNAVSAAIEGEYESNFLFALESSAGELWNLQAFKELRKLIKSMRIKRASLSPRDIGFVNLRNNEFEHLSELIDQTSPEYLILFLSTWKFKEVEIRKYETQKIGSINVLRLPDLEEVKLNVDNKQKTWSSIKRYLDM